MIILNIFLRRWLRSLKSCFIGAGHLPIHLTDLKIFVLRLVLNSSNASITMLKTDLDKNTFRTLCLLFIANGDKNLDAHIDTRGVCYVVFVKQTR